MLILSLASTVFSDPQLLTIADLEHSESQERWFSVGSASNGKVRLISARKATQTEILQYEEAL